MGGTKTAIGAFDKDHTLLFRHQYDTDLSLSKEELKDQLAKEIQSLLTREGVDDGQLGGIGIGLPSFLDFERGYVKHTTNIPRLNEYAFRDALQAYFPVPIFLDNDANLAALAEHRHGSGQGFPHMIYSTASTGIGGGLIFFGRIFRGSYSSAGEIGHAIITPGQGVFCGCGNQGDFESYAGGANIYKHVERRVEAGETTVMTQMAPSIKDITGKTLNAAYHAGDAMAAALLDQIARYLGILYYNLYVTLNINCYVIGGGLLHFGDALMNGIRRTFDQFLRHPRSDEPVYIRPASLKQDFGIIGAVELLFSELEEKKTLAVQLGN